MDLAADVDLSLFLDHQRQRVRRRVDALERRILEIRNVPSLLESASSGTLSHSTGHKRKRLDELDGSWT